MGVTGRRIQQLKTVLVDFDGTLMDHAWPGPLPRPRPGAVWFMRELIRRGYVVLIFTSRAWPGWVEKAGQEFFDAQYRQMVDWLNEYGVPFHGITYRKEPAMLMVDDRAMNSVKSTWAEILEFLDGETEYGRVGMGQPFKIEEGKDASR